MMLFEYPIKIIKDTLNKYTKEDRKKEKLHIKKDKKFKYTFEKD